MPIFLDRFYGYVLSFSLVYIECYAIKLVIELIMGYDNIYNAGS